LLDRKFRGNHAPVVGRDAEDFALQQRKVRIVFPACFGKTILF